MNLYEALQRKAEIMDKRRRENIGKLVMNWFAGDSGKEISVSEIYELVNRMYPYSLILKAMEDLIAENKVIMWHESDRIGNISYMLK